MWWIFICVILIYFFYKKFIKPLSYWKDRGVPYFDAYVAVGFMARALFRKVSVYDLLIEMYEKNSGHRFVFENKYIG